MKTLRLLRDFSIGHKVDVEIHFNRNLDFLGNIIEMRNDRACRSIALSDSDIENCPDISIILNQMFDDLTKDTKELEED